MAARGQVRVAFSGHVTGIDMVAALALADARGFDKNLMAELLPWGEAGMVEALNERDD